MIDWEDKNGSRRIKFIDSDGLASLRKPVQPDMFRLGEIVESEK